MIFLEVSENSLYRWKYQLGVHQIRIIYDHCIKCTLNINDYQVQAGRYKFELGRSLPKFNNILVGQKIERSTIDFNFSCPAYINGKYRIANHISHAAIQTDCKRKIYVKWLFLAYLIKGKWLFSCGEKTQTFCGFGHMQRNMISGKILRWSALSSFYSGLHSSDVWK